MMRTQIDLDKEWRFHLGDEPKAVRREFDDSSWRRLNVPHDWSIEGTPHPDNPAGAGGGFFPGGIGWYRRDVAIPADLGNGVVLIEFDGVYMNSEVYCNGFFCGRRPYGYSSFCYDLTPFVTPGETAVVSVRVDNSRQKNSRWYTGSGIYRHVRLTFASPVRVDHWGVSVTTPEVTDTEARVVVSAAVINSGSAPRDVQISTSVLAPDSETSEEIASSSRTVAAPAGGRSEVESRLSVAQPDLWSPEHPALYTLRTTLASDGEVLDVYDTTFGVRTIRFDADRGFFLNGENVKLKGVNEHHDAGCLGAAVPDDVLRRRFRILKQMGCNAIRVAHNPAAPAFLDLCDEMGFLVVEDAFDEFRAGKTEFGYQLYWDMWWERDLSDMIRRDRNHPSIILWSVGNEIIEVREGRSDGLPMMKALREVCHREDPTRPMTCGCNAIRVVNAAGYGPLMDVVGYNGGGGSCFDYEKDHATFPDRIIFASEVPHTLQTRGVYRTRTWYRDLARNPDVERLDVPHLTETEVFPWFDDHYQSSYDNAMVRISAIDSWRLTNALPFLCGEFRWTGFDYIGECYRWPAKSWNFGVIDLCGFPKDTYYYYQSQWSSEPMVHILPHWSWPKKLEGTTIPVIVYSNCDAVEVFLDEQSLGAKTLSGVKEKGAGRSSAADGETGEPYLRWDVPYSPGTLRAVGFLGGRPVAGCRHVTAGAASAVALRADGSTVRADGTGTVHVEIRIVDDRGNLVWSADPELIVTVSGPGTLIGLENGDPIDTTNYKRNTRRAFHGMALAVVQAKDQRGTIRVEVAADPASSDPLNIGSAEGGAVLSGALLPGAIDVEAV